MFVKSSALLHGGGTPTSNATLHEKQEADRP